MINKKIKEGIIRITPGEFERTLRESETGKLVDHVVNSCRYSYPFYEREKMDEVQQYRVTDYSGTHLLEVAKLHVYEREFFGRNCYKAVTCERQSLWWRRVLCDFI